MPIAFLHGLASSPLSRKGRFLQSELAERGVTLQLPDLNRPSFARLTFGGALEALDGMDAGAGGSEPWQLIGSSMGGYLGARWAQLHPGRVDRLVLLCPGFDLVTRWSTLLGEENLRRWREAGSLPFPDGAGKPTPVHYRLYEEALEHPPTPEVVCPTLIIHGSQDEVVPIEGSRRYAAGRPHVELIELDDDHRLYSSQPRIVEEVVRFFGL